MTRWLRRLAVELFFRLGGVALGRWFFRRECVVLTYHGVIPAGPDAADDREGKFVLEPDFIAQLDYLRRHYVPVDLARFEASLHGGPPLPERALLVTSDDGYENNVRHMVPHLAARRIPAVIFATTGMIGTERTLWTNRVELWWTRHAKDAPAGDRPADMGEMKKRLKALPPDERERKLDEWIGPESGSIPPDHPFRMMDWDGARRCEAAGVAIGSHTVSHAILAGEDEATSRRELVESRRTLERELGHPVTSFAYPNGGAGFFLPRDERLAGEAGYRVAFAAIRGRHRAGDDPFAVIRVPVSREEGWLPLFAARLAFPYRLKDRLK